MDLSSPRFRSHFLAVCLLGSLVEIHPCARAQTEQGIKDAAAALETLFELGLPDTRGAKWVNAQTAVYSPPLFDDERWGGGGNSEGGNGWLVKEQAGGLVDLVVNQTHTIRGKKSDGESEAIEETENAKIPPVNLRPADLGKDATGFLARLKKVSAKAKTVSEEEDYQLETMRSQCGAAILFLAHLQRNGQKDIVREALPLVISLAGSSDAALNSAISALANQRLKSLAEAWSRDGNAAAYASGVDAVVAQFPRGWQERKAAEMLARRLRAPAPVGLEPEVSETAKLLLSLSKEEAALLPINTVWLLPKVEGEADSPGAGRAFLRSMGRRMMRSGPDSPEAKLPPALEKFFSEPRRAAGILAKLQDDRRMTRVPRGDDDGYSFPSYIHGQSEGQTVEQQYGMLSRPTELGELAKQILGSVLPDRIRGQMGTSASGSPAIGSWIESLAKLSDEELAWNYLRSADSTSDSQFDVSLQFLVAKGGEATLAKLEEVFLDPAVWSGNDEPMMQAVEKYLARRGGDPTAFGEKLKATAKRAMEEQKRNREQYSQGDEDEAKRQKQLETAFFKRIDALFKPTSLAEVLNEVVASNDEDAMTIMQTLQGLVPKVPRAEAEAQVLQATARAKTPAIKQMLLGVIGAVEEVGTPSKHPKFPEDAPTRAAIQALLADESVLPPQPWGGQDSRTVADATAAVLFTLHSTPESLTESQKVSAVAPQLISPWSIARAKALAAGQPAPPVPDATKVSAEEIQKLLAELAALPAKDCLKAIQGKSLDQQLALITHLRKPETVWPEKIRAAHLTISRVSVTEADVFDAKGWEGRIFDEAGNRELSEAFEKASLEGKTSVMMAQSSGILTGLSITVIKYKQPMQMENLQSIGIKFDEGQKPPDFLFGQMVQAQGETSQAISSFRLFWKDAALTAAWQKQHEAAIAKEGAEEAKPRNAMRNDPKALEKALKAFMESAPENRGAPTVIRWFSAKIAEPGKESEDEE